MGYSFKIPGWPSSKPTYELLPDDHNNNKQLADQSLSPIPSQRSHLLILYLCITALTAALCIVTVLYTNLLLLQHQQPLQPSPPTLSCGQTISEAKAHGCTFDHLTKTWLPAACSRHGEPNFLKIAAGNNETQWPYFSDPNGLHSLTIDELSAAAATDDGDGQEWWTTTREHLTSCAWMTIRMAHAVGTGERVDGLAGSSHHVRHCTLLMLGWAWRNPDEELDQVYKTLGGMRTGLGTC